MIQVAKDVISLEQSIEIFALERKIAHYPSAVQYLEDIV